MVVFFRIFGYVYDGVVLIDDWVVLICGVVWEVLEMVEFLI